MKTKYVFLIAGVVIGIFSTKFLTSLQTRCILQKIHMEEHNDVINDPYRSCKNCGYYEQQDTPERYEGSDPSLEPCFDFDDNLDYQYRFVADFNGDGLNDVAIARGRHAFGNGGGVFMLYLQLTNGVYREAGEFGTYPSLDLIRIENVEYSGVVNFWTHGRVSSRELIIFQQEIDYQGNLTWGNRIQCYFHGGDDIDSINNRIWNEVFNKPHTTPIRLEKSNSTNELGQAVWVLVDEYIPPAREETHAPTTGEN